jgi:hypothetical protein
MEKWGKYDKFASYGRRCGGIGVQAARLPIRESRTLEIVLAAERSAPRSGCVFHSISTANFVGDEFGFANVRR